MWRHWKYVEISDFNRIVSVFYIDFRTTIEEMEQIQVDQLQSQIKWYVILGFSSIFCYWLGYSLWVRRKPSIQFHSIQFHFFR